MIRKIRQAAVIGSGVMGGGIAALFASAGIKTLLLDIVPFDLRGDEKNDPSARNRIVKSGLEKVAKSKPPLLMHEKDLDRITIGNVADDSEKLSQCDWIVEAVVENVEIKQDIFKKIEKVKKREAIVSTNTSGIPLTSMSTALSREFRRHFLGTHFFNPVRYMKLLEIIPGEETLQEILDFIADFGERVLGKGIVWAKDTPNFVGNRIGVQGMMKAMNLMVEEGLSIPEVDALFGPAIGRPKTAMFKLSDMVGLDTLGFVAKNTYRLVVDDEERDSFILPEFIEKMIENKLLGKKTQKGFYLTTFTDKKEKIRKVINPSTLEYEEYDRPTFPCLVKAKQAKTLPEKIRAIVYGEDKGAQFAWKIIANGLIYAANRIPGISETIVNIDNAMKWGFNFKLGPFETWDAIGLSESVEKMDQEGFLVPEKIRQMLKAGVTSFYKSENKRVFFYDFSSKTYQERVFSEPAISLNSLKADEKQVQSCNSASLIDLEDGVFCLEFHTRMNAINMEIVGFMDEAMAFVDTNGIGLVVGNQSGGTPAVFSAGADLLDLSSLAMQRKFSEIETFLKTAQNTIQKARYSPFPVVAAPYGLTLAGGCELCLGVDRIVAHAELYMGLVEIGVGLLPAGGGCLNLWKKFISAIPEAVTDTDLAKFFIPVFRSIAMAKVSTSAADAKAIGFLGPNDRIVFNRDYLIGEAKKEVLRMVNNGYAPPVKRKIKVLGQAAQGLIQAEIFNMLHGKFITEYDAVLAKRIAFVISGGHVRDNSEIAEDVILTLERDACLDFLKEEKTHARVEHMLKTGKPLRN